ncbi:hypothetical protein [Polycladospora coralii]|uniref:hypothetical protein n=1 Tax=Polycladospora coralii TaxID=2771432 RepID=UPI001CD10532|nr:hypothetical protein [Polycladospora coralii]
MNIYFYKIHDDFGCFSHFSPHGFELDGQYWKTREHYFQCQKYAGSAYGESPMIAARLGPIRSDCRIG